MRRDAKSCAKALMKGITTGKRLEIEVTAGRQAGRGMKEKQQMENPGKDAGFKGQQKGMIPAGQCLPQRREASRREQLNSRADLKLYFLRCDECQSALNTFIFSQHFVCHKGEQVKFFPRVEREGDLWNKKGDFHLLISSGGERSIWSQAEDNGEWHLFRKSSDPLSRNSFPGMSGPVRKAAGDAEMCQVRGVRDTLINVFRI